MIRIIVAGACGRVGAAVLRLAAADPDFVVTHLLEAKGHRLIGTRIDAPGEKKTGYLLEDDLAGCIDDCDVIIDFTEPKATVAAFGLAVPKNKAMVIGTTAIPQESLDAMRKTPGARAVISPNMSIGVNLLFSLTEKAAAVLGKGYDAEIMEMHHRLKKDAPSGTALKLREMIKGADPGRPWIDVTGRQGMVGERKPDEIGLFALRGGDIVGEHTVFFAGPGERLEITHRAYSRENFARGALVAARWIVGKEPGIYDMAEVLGLK
ncbi:MAG TPA: 4-hydroxy-tetrahydrodipicolinate reductase [Syntrophorhabdales bacterium]|nr:4-hydroxy-tetrahydrodipicolinate reductase [Syntrophorhabdales bacterium]